MSQGYTPFCIPQMQKLTIAQAVGVYCLVSVWINMIYPLKLLTYAMPFFALIAILSEKRFTLPPHAPPYILLMIAGIAFAPLTTLLGWQDFYLMLMGLAPFCFGYKYKLKWETINYATLIAAVLGILLAKSGHGGSFEFDAAKSKSSFEHPTSFVFGLLAVWAALERKWKNVAFAMVLCILTLKRIVVLAAFVAILMSLCPRALAKNILRPIPMLAFNALALIFVFLYTQGHFDFLIAQSTKQSADQFGMGRQALYRIPVNTILHHPAEFIFHGVGAGGVYDLIKLGHGFSGKPNLHNDPLKIFVEYGGLVLVMFISALFWRKEWHIKIIMLFVSILFLTDNSLIYPYMIFAYGLVFCNIRVRETNLKPRRPLGGHGIRPQSLPITIV